MSLDTTETNGSASPVEGVKAELDELRGQHLLMSASVNQTLEVAQDARAEVRAMRAELALFARSSRAPTIATGGVLAVLANQLVPQLTDAHAMASQGPTASLVTLAVLVATLLVSRLQGRAPAPQPAQETPTVPPPGRLPMDTRH